MGYRKWSGDFVDRVIYLREKEKKTYREISEILINEFSLDEFLSGEQVRGIYRRGKESRKLSLLREPAEKEILEGKQRQEKIEDLEHKIKEILASRKIIEHIYGKHFKLGIISDTHIGSLYENPMIVESLYKIFRREKVEAVYHSGDMIDGFGMYRGHEFEVYALGLKDQVKEVVESYPNEGLKTFFITGGHDLSFYRKVGQDPGGLITEKREDLVYLGKEQIDVEVEKGVVMRLAHPGKGTAYALSYHPQKYVESLSGGQKPDIILFGHYHKAELMPCYRNTFVLQCGCTQSQTDYMKRGGLAAHLGGWIIEVRIDKKNLVSSFKAEFVAFYEENLRRRIPLLKI